MIKISLTDDIIKVLPLIKISKKEDDSGFEIISNNLFWGGTVLENIMQAWGKYDEHIPGTELSEEGRMWDEELEKKAWDTYDYIINHLDDIISIIFYIIPNVLVFKKGTYTRKKKSPGIWDFKPLET